MYLELPVRSDLPSYTFQQDFEGTLFELEFNWNSRGEFWVMDINDSESNPILTGLRVVTDFSLTKYNQVDGLPPGQFIAYDTAGFNKDPGIDDFGNRVILVYRESTTVDE